MQNPRKVGVLLFLHSKTARFAPGSVEGVRVELRDVVPVQVEAPEGGDLVDPAGDVRQPAVPHTGTTPGI